MTLQEFVILKSELDDIVEVVNKHAISLEQIAKISKLLGMIADQGKLDIYIRVLFDGAYIGCDS